VSTSKVFWDAWMRSFNRSSSLMSEVRAAFTSGNSCEFIIRMSSGAYTSGVPY
jgi:hypothetical protein